MRDIKFRAWDKQYKKMDNVIMFLFDKNEIDIAIHRNKRQKRERDL
jgi:hypothetical protein